MNYGSPTGSNVHSQNQYISPPAYQQQKTAIRFNPQSPRLTGVPPYPKNVQTPPSVSYKNNTYNNGILF